MLAALLRRAPGRALDRAQRALLRAAGERLDAAIDNLNRAERLGLITSADSWPIMRRLRNRLVHEYMDDPAAMAPALRQAHDFVDELHCTYVAICDFATGHFGR